MGHPNDESSPTFITHAPLIVFTVLYFIFKRFNDVDTYIQTLANAGDYNLKKLVRIFQAMDWNNGVLGKTIFITKIRKETAANYPGFFQGTGKNVKLHNK